MPFATLTGLMKIVDQSPTFYACRKTPQSSSNVETQLPFDTTSLATNLQAGLTAHLNFQPTIG